MGGVALTLVLIESRSPWSCHEPEFKKALLPLFHILHPPGIIMNFGIIIIFMAEYGEYGHKIMHQKRCVDVYRWACAIFSIILQGTWDSAKVVQTGEFEDMECDLVRPFHFLVLTWNTGLPLLVVRWYAALGTRLWELAETFLVIQWLASSQT